ncbi:hypothetical protein B0H11DRAFT_1899811 [Mycena galericulata]|nr:hypothetical protein B0H11DRAFT_1899811 [Mycena galericulata]
MSSSLGEICRTAGVKMALDLQHYCVTPVARARMVKTSPSSGSAATLASWAESDSGRSGRTPANERTSTSWRKTSSGTQPVFAYASGAGRKSQRQERKSKHKEYCHQLNRLRPGPTSMNLWPDHLRTPLTGIHNQGGVQEEREEENKLHSGSLV